MRPFMVFRCLINCLLALCGNSTQWLTSTLKRAVESDFDDPGCWPRHSGACGPATTYSGVHRKGDLRTAGVSHCGTVLLHVWTYELRGYGPTPLIRWFSMDASSSTLKITAAFACTGSFADHRQQLV